MLRVVIAGCGFMGRMHANVYSLLDRAKLVGFVESATGGQAFAKDFGVPAFASLDDALQGAETSLRLHRPIVSVTTYHSDAGLWKLPSWLMSRLTDYRYYLRLHSWCGTGAVMYCVPAERIGARSNPKGSQWGERR